MIQCGNAFVKRIVMEHWWLCDVCKSVDVSRLSK